MGSVCDWLQRNIPKIVIAPSVAATLMFIYGFIGWTVYVSFTKSKIRPKYEFEGLIQYKKLMASARWDVAFENMIVFSILFILIAMLVGIFLAILLDQKVRNEGFIRTIYLYPMALSLIVTGTVWKWVMNPDLGLEKAVRNLGWESFKFDWIIDSNMAIYAIVSAAVWQASGFVMALFLGALRGINPEIINAARIEGAGLPRIYARIIIPSLGPTFVSTIVVLAHLAIKSFDIVVAMTSGGPGYATILPANYVQDMAFTRGNLGQAASAAVVMLVAIMSIMIPYLYSELHRKKP